ncbi:MAG: MgtC/SapB family protein [Oscillospiraceae bacterium]|nr:MgtC/SapB family protein [Oscillospiraceae bacterium]MDD6503123.1 MgtC/SapB family protein [Oscillospiraceae bacterium]MDY4104997.1 MgtC/SapB family protein [Oscillospiraceae bacterium]
MSWFLSQLHELTFLSMVLRFLTATLAGAVIGYSRGKAQHAAGLRTHILVCIGAAGAMIVGEYLVSVKGFDTDAARIPAQVISGIGFLGAGSIIVTGRSHVTGLTTAAGLWASACMGLAAGAGYFSCVLVMCVLILLVLEILYKVDKHYVSQSRQMFLYLEMQRGTRMGTVLSLLNEHHVRVYAFDRLGTDTEECLGYRLNVEIEDRDLHRSDLITMMSGIDGVLYVSEM